jgi:hypothetical protein
MSKFIFTTRVCLIIAAAGVVLVLISWWLESAEGGPIPGRKPQFWRGRDIVPINQVPVASGTPMLGTSTTVETGTNSVVIGAGGPIKLKP